MRTVICCPQGLAKGNAPGAAQMAALSRKAAEAQLQLTDSRRDATEVTRCAPSSTCELVTPYIAWEAQAEIMCSHIALPVHRQTMRRGSVMRKMTPQLHDCSHNGFSGA